MGREFLHVFEDWADSYDDTVSGHDPEYAEAFQYYERILATVAEKAQGTVMEFGVGTGNLTEKLLARGLQVYGIEPSAPMREKAEAKLSQVTLLDGDFLQFPTLEDTVHTVVSTYAFHHLTDEEKDVSIGKFSGIIPVGGKIVFADTVFENEQRRQEILEEVEGKGYRNLLHDLRTEHYTTIDVMQNIFTKHGFDVTFSQCNKYVWLMEAVKK